MKKAAINIWRQVISGLDSKCVAKLIKETKPQNNFKVAIPFCISFNSAQF